MTDLTKITTPFGLLDKETQDALKAHGGPWEMYTGKWNDTSRLPAFFDHVVYRVKPSPLVETKRAAGECFFKSCCNPADLWDRPLRGHFGTYTLTLHDGKPVKLVWEAE